MRYDHNAEDRYLNGLLADELAIQDLSEEIDDRMEREIEELEAEGIKFEDLDEIDFKEIRARVIADIQEERQQRSIDKELDRYWI
ncbi:hypothetical protein WMO13_06690 [Ignatzschineria larvae DSM 13226]|uniref:Uncharacterized protein n=1 Tax=Ignatzschineria larvae DSM 13226 TaxID=1111732 RepID=A0ABZ3C1T1_9GAMM|nr:hypothetical protein [Ignatzschineria larvae]